MTESLQKRIHTLVQQTFAVRPGAWIVWCDPGGHWRLLLQRVANDKRLGGFELIIASERTAGVLGSPTLRRDVQARMDAGASFVLYIPAPRQALGWLWAQALLAERIYESPLRSQLADWGWKPTRLTMSDEEVATLALALLQQDPVKWQQEGIQPDLDLLLDLLAEGITPDEEKDYALQLTTEATGLPPFQPTDALNWRVQSLARLLVTQAHFVAPEAIPENHLLLIPAEQRSFARQLLARWVDSHRFAEKLPELCTEADRVAALAANFANLGADVQPLVSRAAEYSLFIHTCAIVSQASGTALLEQFAALYPHLERHRKSFWGHRLAGHADAIPWGELERLSAAARELLEATPAPTWSNPQEVIAWYVDGGWRMDRAGEAMTRSLSLSDPALVKVVGPLRATYRARWEESLIRWSTLWKEAGCPIPTHLPSMGSKLKQTLDAKQRPTAILVVDALRYDLGATLAEAVNRAEQAERAHVQPVRSPLPSITALGMAQALPLAESALVAELVEGKWQMRHAKSGENLSIAEQRRAWWSANQKSVRWMTMAETNSVGVPKPGNDCQQLVIHDAAIDKLGHDDELEFQGSDEILKRYHRLIERLRDQGWWRILVVTDHGYIHWTSSEEKSVAPPLPEPAYSSRRAAAYLPANSLPGPHALTTGGKWQVAFPYGAASFRAYGGLGYFHGGAALQEWIIPFVAIEWPVKAKPVQVRLRPLERILTLKPKVIVEVSASNLLKEDSVPRQVQVIIRHAKTRLILFKSATQTAQPDQSVLELTLDVQPEIIAERNTPLSIELRDPNTEEVLDSVDSKLLTELTGW